jgi:hypothetical protein
VLDNVLLVTAAPVDPRRLARVLDGASTVLSVPAAGDPLTAVADALRVFAASRIVLAGPDLGRDLTGAIEDRFGRPVFAVVAA